jgi:hypothetical protein
MDANSYCGENSAFMHNKNTLIKILNEIALKFLGYTAVYF